MYVDRNCENQYGGRALLSLVSARTSWALRMLLVEVPCWMFSVSMQSCDVAAMRLQGHGSTIEDVVFKPGSAVQLASVGDDKRVLLWDTRAGAKPATKVENAHGGDHDLHTVDWCRLREHMLATGAQCLNPTPLACSVGTMHSS